MPRIAGVEIPAEKRIEIALTYIYGIGRSNVKKILQATKIDPDKRAKTLTDHEVALLQKAVEQFPVEGVLRKIVSENIKRLKQIGSYRGLRHSQRLPVRGQRTRSNARTKRGKRVTIGALRKEMAQKLETAKEAPKEVKK
ncbi:30S ribosomal protein S13 [Candidatus Beckwithbacteria bacterium RBG_13_42_9]|uniref:Small ribosomal subunit protein uS13 n=1 Tax=Candidatus Beckwithbacteria bacterium RBG_13_42_9 TaxID=1797457 RepID=A0A1F5E962_9BACT|nr:MAG: 30S ribosomal protein S13 [Candidatus Beckwithbacteria bacterium RBG_13_42_9]